MVKEAEDMSRLAQAKRKLARLENEYATRIDKIYAHQKLTNGQPMNDKRNGSSWFRQHDRLEHAARAVAQDIEKQKERVAALQAKNERKEQGLNKQGGLLMTVDNIPRIKEELKKAEEGNSTFSPETIRKYEKEVENLEKLKTTAEAATSRMGNHTQELIDSGKLNQWRKNPSIYFVKGLRKVALELQEDGTFVVSEKYAPSTESEKNMVSELLTPVKPSIAIVPALTADPFGSEDDVFDNQLADARNFWQEAIARGESFEIVGKTIENGAIVNQGVSKTFTPSTRENVAFQLTDYYEGKPVSHYDISQDELDALVAADPKEWGILSLFPKGSNETEYEVRFVGTEQQFSNHEIQSKKTSEVDSSIDHYRVEFNESDPKNGIPDFSGKIVTEELISSLELADFDSTTKDSYYKLFLESVKDGKVVESFRLDLGDGLTENEQYYQFLRKVAVTEEQAALITNSVGPSIASEKESSPKTTNKKNSERRGYAKKTSQELRKETNDLVSAAMENVKNHLNSENDVLEYANFMSQFYDYSFKNTALINKQYPHAVAVAGAKHFKDKGFYIRKGEKAIRVLAPTTFNYFVDEVGVQRSISTASAAQKKLIEAEKLKTGKSTRFKNVPVFDISQTTATAEDLPKIFPNRSFDFDLSNAGNISLLRKSLNGYAALNGITINDNLSEVSSILGTAKGAYTQTIDGENHILMNPRYSEGEQIPTLIHELAHAKLHAPEQQANHKYSKSVKEFQAELTSYIVCKHYGIDTEEEAIPYIASWTKNGLAVEDKLDQMEEVKKFSRSLIVDIDAQMEQAAEMEQNVENKIEAPAEEEEKEEKQKYKNFSEQIDHARKISIVDIAMQNGIDLVQESRKQYRVADNHSLVITTDKNLWIENNGSYGGGPIDFVQKVVGVENFKEAVRMITENDYEEAKISNEPKGPFVYSKENEAHFSKAKDYLVNERGIDSEIVTYLHGKGLLQQDKRNNLLMMWNDEGKTVGCSEKGTIPGSQWRKIQANSDDLTGFNIRNGQARNLKFFEAGVDMLSYMTLNKGNLKDTWLVSMEGLKPETVYNYVGLANKSGDLESISLCVDNDEGGRKFADRFENIEVKQKDKEPIDILPEFPSLPVGKKEWDWNDELLQRKSEAKIKIGKKLCEQESLAV